MIKVQFFAGIREALGTGSVELEVAAIRSVEDVVKVLCDEHPSWEEVLRNKRVLVALNQEMTTLAATVSDGDEVALFPPVTGG